MGERATRRGPRSQRGAAAGRAAEPPSRAERQLKREGRRKARWQLQLCTVPARTWRSRRHFEVLCREFGMAPSR